MSDSHTFSFISEGEVPVGIRKAITEAVQKAKGQLLTLTLAKARDKASDRQRKYYFAVIVKGYQDYYRKAGGKSYSKDEMHDILMTAIGGFTKPLVNPITGVEQFGRMSWNELYKQGAESYFTMCREYAARKLHFDIPEPREGMDYPMDENNSDN